MCSWRWLPALLGGVALAAQGQAAPQPSPPASTPRGQVLFSREQPGTPQEAAPASAVDAAPAQSTPALTGQAGQPQPGQPQPGATDQLPAVPVTDAERAAVEITGYDLDLRLRPEDAQEMMLARVTVRNTGTGAMARVPLQISSTLRFESASAEGADGVHAAAFTQSPVATDADHTGYAEEAVVTLPIPLAPGATAILRMLYSGTVAQSSERLALLGVSAEKAAQTDWDAIAPAGEGGGGTALRGFGNVLWYPVASPLALLGDGNRLFALAGEQRRRNASATVRLRLTVESAAGGTPGTAIFNGEPKALTQLPGGDVESATAPEVLSTAEWSTALLGFRLPSLFLTEGTPVPGTGDALQALTPEPDRLVPYREAVRRVETLQAEWFGVQPERPVLLLDHPGEPFADAALLVGPLDAHAPVDETARRLVAPMTHAWFRSRQPWEAEGLAEFLRLLWTEREAGREAALAQLVAEDRTLALVEPAEGGGEGQPLLHASQDVLLRVKGAAVWWQLRDILGEDTLRQALAAYRTRAADPGGDAPLLQHTLEQVSGKELGWFFTDWVEHDRGLPELAIVQVNTRALPARAGKDGGYLVAVEVRNSGGAVAEVPVTVSAGSLTATERLRVAAGATASVRVVFQGTPEQVTVNDGSVPEIGPPEHTFTIRQRE